MITELCEALNVDSDEVLGRSRKKDISAARSIYFWLMYQNGYNYSQIGKLCDRSHATIIHSVKSIDGAIEVNDPLIMPLVEKAKQIKYTKQEIKSNRMIIAVDFDGTLHTGDFPNIGAQANGAKEIMDKLKADGHYLIIWTCRCGDKLTEALNWLLDQGIPFDRVNEHEQGNLELYKTNSRKVYAHLYIDDKQVGGLPSWSSIYQYVCKVEKEYNEKQAV